MAAEQFKKELVAFHEAKALFLGSLIFNFRGLQVRFLAAGVAGVAGVAPCSRILCHITPGMKRNAIDRRHAQVAFSTEGYRRTRTRNSKLKPQTSNLVDHPQDIRQNLPSSSRTEPTRSANASPELPVPNQFGGTGYSRSNHFSIAASRPEPGYLGKNEPKMPKTQKSPASVRARVMKSRLVGTASHFLFGPRP